MLKQLAYSSPVKDATSTGPETEAPDRADLSSALRRCRAEAGHFDELRGDISNGAPVAAPFPAAWEHLLQSCSDRSHDLQTLPWLIGASTWQQIQVGVSQRARLLEHIMADVYGPQQLLQRGLLPAELVFGQPGYLRAMHGVKPSGGIHLHILGFDLMRQPNGAWCVLRQHCQVPSGWGDLLRNRARSASLLQAALEALAVRALGPDLEALLNALQPSRATQAEVPLAVLSQGHGHPDYVEHSRLARELGLTLVCAGELAVHDQALYMKALPGLLPVPCLIKLLDDEDLDPLEMRGDSHSGVPGLLQSVRVGKLRVTNAPGSALLEAPSLHAYLPDLAHHLLGAELALSSADADTGPAQRHASQFPVWHSRTGVLSGEWRMSSVTLRVFAWTDSQRTWHVLPGGLACVAGASGQVGDVWILGEEKSTPSSTLPEPLLQPRRRPGSLSRRSAEQLFWLGRYSQRYANVAALARLVTRRLKAARRSSPTLLGWLGNMALQNGLLAADGSTPWLDAKAFDLALGRRLEPTLGTGGLADKLNEAVASAAGALEHLPETHAQAMNDAQALMMAGSMHAESVAPGPAGRAAWLETVSAQLATISALQTGDPVRPTVRRLLSIGHGVERLGFQLAGLRAAIACDTIATLEGLEALHELFNADTAGRSLGQSCTSRVELLTSLLAGPVEVASLSASAQALQSRLSAPEGDLPDPLCRLASSVPVPSQWGPEAHTPQRLTELLRQSQSDVFELSNAICSACASGPREWPAST